MPWRTIRLVIIDRFWNNGVGSSSSTPESGRRFKDDAGRGAQPCGKQEPMPNENPTKRFHPWDHIPSAISEDQSRTLSCLPRPCPPILLVAARREAPLTLVVLDAKCRSTLCKLRTRAELRSRYSFCRC